MSRFRREATVLLHQGFHGWTTSRFVSLAKAYDATIRVSAEATDGAVDGQRKHGDGKSIFGMSALQGVVRRGDVVTIQAEGPDAEAAVAELSAWLERGLGAKPGVRLREAQDTCQRAAEAISEILDRNELTREDRNELRRLRERMAARWAFVSRTCHLDDDDLEPVTSDRRWRWDGPTTP